MKKPWKKTAVYMLSLSLMTSFITFSPGSPLSIVTEAHQGRTDSRGGHKDNKNKSGLGGYHYHCGGNSAHLHSDGSCPYSSTDTNQQNNDTKNTSEAKPKETKPTEAPAVETGWHQDHIGWWYQESEDQYYTSCFASIDQKTYYFNESGYMTTGWFYDGSDWFYFSPDGSMVTGEQYIDHINYYFDSDGKLAENF